jgi:hypothetical protein
MVITGVPYWENDRLMGQLEKVYYYQGRENLLFSCEFVRFRDKWYLWMYVSGSFEVAEEFICDITFYDQICDGRNWHLNIKSTHPLPVVSVKKPIWDVIEKGPVLSFSDEYVLEHVRQERWYWHLYTRLTLKPT